MIARLWSLLSRPHAAGGEIRRSPENSSRWVPVSVAEESALAHVESAHRIVVRARSHTGQWLTGHRRLTTRDALKLADAAREAAEHLRSYAAYITAEVALAEELANADPDDLGGGAA